MICILGPTASGKTDLAIELRQSFGFDVISVDSALVYKRMDIGTAKPDESTLAHTPHALINLIEPWETYSVSQFLAGAKTEIDRSHAIGNIPLLVGGTMLYFHSLWHGLSSLPPADPATRSELQQQLDIHGSRYLHQRLMSVDPESAKRIDPHDPQRLLRALEVFLLTGTPLSQLQKQRAGAPPYDFYNIGFFPVDRSVLHHNIATRFEHMLNSGFIDEVQELLAEPDIHAGLPSMRCVGYRQACAYLNGHYSHSLMCDKAIAATRQLGKRQMTWMRKMENLTKVELRFSAKQLLADKQFMHWREKHRFNTA